MRAAARGTVFVTIFLLVEDMADHAPAATTAMTVITGSTLSSRSLLASPLPTMSGFLFAARAATAATS